MSQDLTNWTASWAPCSSPQRNGAAWDDSTTWTGSVVQDDDGLWHLFYTGTTLAEQSLYQRIGHATSTDLHNWTRVGDGLCLDMTGPNADCYEKDHAIGHWHDRAMRDPWVMRDPDGDGWLMYFTARVARHRRTERRRGHRLCHLARPDDLDPATPGLSRRLWPAGGAAGLSGRTALVLPVLHLGRPLVRPVPPRQPADPGHRHALPDRRPPARPVAHRRPVPSWTGPSPVAAMPPASSDGPQGLVILGFADSGKDQFGGYVMDPEPVVGRPGRAVCTLHPSPQAAE